MKTSLFKKQKFNLTLVLIVVGLISSACMPWGRGTYQIEIFSEMHYAQSYKSQEPPRLYPAQGSVPFMSHEDGTDGILNVASNFLLEKTEATVSAGSGLYQVNCAACHGMTGKGDGAAKSYLIKHGGLPPADITGPATAMASDTELKGFIGLGGRIGYYSGGNKYDSPSAMPMFNKLLTDEELWQLVHYVRSLQN
ncbi:MAG: cytochrome c [SAR202 cluster bacterium]|nr:cytochrome c [SAR202 cluster bacterium]|tara:strand:+ start:26511 stop:27095 length:585 start_codon:yes stop_codon:yes gene_type:complete